MKWRKEIIVVAVGIMYATVIVFMVDTSRTFRIAQERQTEQFARQADQLRALQTRLEQRTEESERATAQANTSVDQLTKAGIDPIVAAPEVVTVPTEPVPTTRAPVPPPLTIIQPPPVATPQLPPETTPTVTQPPATDPPPTDPPPTEPPPVTDPPPTDPPPTEPPPTEPPPTEPPPTEVPAPQ